MSYFLESLDEKTKKLIFSFDSLDLTQKIKKELIKQQKTLHLKGFRKGKAPLAMVQKIYGPPLEQEALDEFITENVEKALKEEKLLVTAPMNLENLHYESGKSVAFDVIVKILPPVHLKDYSHLSFEEETVKEVTDEDVEDVKQSLLNEEGVLMTIDDSNHLLAEGMTAVVNIQGKKLEGRSDEVFKEEDCPLEVGLMRFPGLDNALTGMKVDDEKTFSAVCPPDFYLQNFRGEEVELTVKVLEIKNKILPEFNDEFAQQHNYDSVDDFMKKCREDILEERKMASRLKLYDKIVKTFVSENPYEIPEVVMQMRREKRKEEMRAEMKKIGFEEKVANNFFEQNTETYDSQLEFNTKKDLIMDALCRNLEIEEDKRYRGTVIDALSKKINIKLNEYTDSFQDR